MYIFMKDINSATMKTNSQGGRRRKRGGHDPEEEESAAKRQRSMEMDHKHNLCMRTVVFGDPDKRTATKPAAPRHRSRSPLRVRCSVDGESIGSRMCTVSIGGGEQGRGGPRRQRSPRSPLCRSHPVDENHDGPSSKRPSVWSRLGPSGAPSHTTSGPEGHRWQRLSVVPPVTTRAEPAEYRAPARNVSQEPSTWYQITIPFGRKYGKEGLLQFLQQGCCTPFTPLQFHFEGDMATFYVVNYMVALNLKALSRKIVFPDNYRAIVLMRPVLGPPSPLAGDLTKDDQRLIEEEAELPQPPASMSMMVPKVMAPSAQPPTVLPAAERPTALPATARPRKAQPREDRAPMALPRTALPPTALPTTPQPPTPLPPTPLPPTPLPPTPLPTTPQPPTPLPPTPLPPTPLPPTPLPPTPQPPTALPPTPLPPTALPPTPLPPTPLPPTPLPPTPLPPTPLPSTPLPPTPLPTTPQPPTALPPTPLPPTPLPPTSLPPTPLPPTAQPPIALPPTSADIQGLIANFLKEYYGLYDTADREGLLKKYQKDALITIYTPSESSLGEEGTDKPTPEDSPQLKCERLTAEDFIKELTHKHHDMSSFTTTVSRGTDTQVNFTVHGFFKETKNCQESVKMFWRVVQLVPTMDGRPSVASERMFIREALSSEMPPAFASTTSATSSSCPLTALTSSQQETVNSFAETSHMTPEWSQRCLERNNWNFSKAADDFIHLYEAGKIPGEAFQ
ncbi:uncharacterized protein LOC116953364 [Petromyzon marinus]|uniref:uncharacterized protein LOC116953364 n=1 Tax=Petromyzon marinus TaxID=7757 RepID=UPI003F7107E3